MITPQQPIVPRPLHNENGTLRALARQILADLDDASLTTAVPTATLQLLLTKLCDLLERPIEEQQRAAALRNGQLLESSSNPNLLYWQRRAEGDEE